MRDIRPFVSPLAAVVLAAAAVRPAAAQQAAATPARPVIRDAAVTVSPALRTVAIYRFATTSGAGIPAEVTVADSAGRLVASYRLPGEREARPMLAAVIGTERADLVLEAETPSGLLTLQLYGQDDPTAGAVSGRWWLGVQQGALRGRVVR